MSIVGTRPPLISETNLYEPHHNCCIKQNGIRFDENMVTGEDMNFVIDYIQCITSIYYTGKSSYCYQREEASRVTRIKKFPEIYLSNLSDLRDKLETLIKE